MSVVLAPIDGSARALRAVPWAASLAGPGGTVVLLRALPPQPAFAEALFAFTGGGHEGVQGIQDAWSDVATADLDEAEKAITGSGVTVERLIAEAEPEEAIAAAADERKVDMIAMASHGRGAIGRAIFGSVADRVSRISTVPVLILRTPDEEVEDTTVRVDRIVAPLDGSELATESLPVVVELAKRFKAPVHVVRVIDPVSGMPVTPGAFGPAPAITSELADRVWRETEAEAKRTVSSAVAHLQAEGVEATGATLTGSPFFSISEATEPGDLIVLTSHGRGGVRRWLLGSVAEKLVREAPAPVMLVPASPRADQVAP
jgi:nucleotide-binding universal stress UspA family protein